MQFAHISWVSNPSPQSNKHCENTGHRLLPKYKGSLDKKDQHKPKNKWVIRGQTRSSEMDQEAQGHQEAHRDQALLTRDLYQSRDGSGTSKTLPCSLVRVIVGSSPTSPAATNHAGTSS